MNSIREKALFYLTGSKDLSLVGEETLIKLANEYPYFAPVQFLLTVKQKENGQDFLNQAQKTSLYFTNPYWLHYLLQQNEAAAEILGTSPVLPSIIEGIQPVTLNKSSSEEPVFPDIEQDIPTKAPIEKSFASGMSIPTIELVKEMMRGIDQQVAKEKIQDTNIDLPTTNTDRVEETRLPTPSQPIQPTAYPKETETFKAASYDEAAATNLSNSKIANLLSSQLADFKKPVAEEEKLEIAREPMHTVDYFASQGIKIDLSSIPQDKLTAQLRRFTDWLKYMKKDNPNPIDLGTRQDLEEAVAIIARTSNEQKEIVTETMADVLQKQGQIDKAIQLYIKLSFINPEKSAYFAAKIQHLKGIQ